MAATAAIARSWYRPGDRVQAVLAWRATDGFTDPYMPFNGGTAAGQWRPTPRLTPPPPTCGPMSAQGWHSPTCSSSSATINFGLGHRGDLQRHIR